MKTTVLTVTFTEKNLFPETELNFNNWITNKFKRSLFVAIMIPWRSTSFDGRRKRLICSCGKKTLFVYATPRKAKIVCMYVLYTLKFRKYFLYFNCEKRHVISQLNY